MDVRSRCCGRCGGALRLDDDGGRLGAARARPLPPFAAFVRREYAALRRRWPRVTHQRIMVELGRKYKRSQAAKAAPSARKARRRSAGG